MRNWEWAGDRWEYRLPALPAFLHWCAFAGGLMSYGVMWAVYVSFLLTFTVVRYLWVQEDPRTTEEIMAAQLEER